MTHRRQNFMGGAAILAGAVAVTKLLGALYKIPLGNLLDREGMAHFYAAYNIYSLLLVLSTAGLPVALSRMVSRAAAQRRYGAVRRCLHLGLALLAALGLVCSAVMCLLPEALAAALHDPDAAPALQTLGPAVLLVCLSAALREKGFAPYYLYRQKYMSGSFENVGWCISGAEGLYNIYIMEELHSILSLGAGGSTKMVDAKRNRIERVFHPKFPLEYIQRPEKLTENLEAFRRFHQEMGR